MESIKIGTQTYELVADGYQLQQDGGRIIFQPGEKTFEEIEAAVSAATSLVLLDETGEPLASRTDLVYAGRMSKQKDYVIRTEKEETAAGRRRQSCIHLQGCDRYRDDRRIPASGSSRGVQVP